MNILTVRANLEKRIAGTARLLSAYKSAGTSTSPDLTYEARILLLSAIPFTEIHLNELKDTLADLDRCPVVPIGKDLCMARIARAKERRRQLTANH